MSSGSKHFSTLSDTQTPLLPIFPLAFIQVSFVHGLLYSFHPVFLRSSSCSLLFRHPLQCSFGQSFFCQSLNMAIPYELVLFNVFYNCFLQSSLSSYSYISNSHTLTHCLILMALPRQQWLREHAPVLHYTDIASCFYCVQSVALSFAEFDPRGRS